MIRRVDPASRPRRAMALWDALVRPPEATADPPRPKPEGAGRSRGPMSTGPKGDGWDGFPVRGTYAQGVAWIVKIVAGALHYAHSQQTFHRDVKPANVLLTLQHGPQLLDFNLAESPHSASQAQAAMHGGTLPYMAPEQIEAFLNPDLWGKVGAQADVYSLGLVLREFLTGQAPDLPAETLAPAACHARAARPPADARRLGTRDQPGDPPRPRGDRRQMPGRLARRSICRRRAAGRGSRRFLERKPLVHAVNPSRRERCANWTIRRRRGVGRLAASACVSLAAWSWSRAIGSSNGASRRSRRSRGLLDAVRMVEQRPSLTGREHAPAATRRLSTPIPSSPSSI